MTPPLVSLYSGLTSVAPCLLRRAGRKAHAKQGAAPERLQERFGKASLARPEARLIWLHAASVGEVQSVTALVPMLAAHGTVLVTTVTATGAARVDKALPEALHQFSPLDTAAAVRGFLNHWRPDLALFVEADVWPRMSAELSRRSIPVALLNARASRTRARAPRFAAHLLKPFELITCQSTAVREGLAELELAVRLETPGDLKADLPIAPPAREALATFKAASAGRPVWAAVSTHAADEAYVMAAHRSVLERHPSALLLWLPRHPKRAETIRGMVDLPLAQHGRNETVNADTTILLQDTLGDTTAAFHTAPLTYLGGGIGKEGGHNPYEPAGCGSYVLSGPRVANFEMAFARLEREGYAALMEPKALANAVLENLSRAHLPPFETRTNAAEETMRLLEPLLER